MQGDISLIIVDPHITTFNVMQGLLVVNNALQLGERRREPGSDHAGAQRQREANRQGLFQKFHCIFPFFAFFGRKGSGSRAAVAEPNDSVHTVGPLTLRSHSFLWFAQSQSDGHSAEGLARFPFDAAASKTLRPIVSNGLPKCSPADIASP
jgi:hypothetical protein